MAESFMSSKFDGTIRRRNMNSINDPIQNEEDEEKSEPEDYDAFNDITFGMDSSGVDDWENNHEQFAMMDNSFGNGGLDDYDSSQNSYHSLKNNDNRKVGLQSHQENDDDDEDDTNIEDSIKGVLDEDYEDPAIVQMYVSKPIPAYRPGETRRYNISPPPPAIVETNNVGSPSTSSIWSTPKVDTNKGFPNSLLQPFKPESPILFDLSLTDSPTTNNDRKIAPHNSLPKQMPNVKTLEELEKDLLNHQNANRAPDVVNKEVHLKQGILTVGELEQNLNISDVATPPKKPIGPPPGFGSKATLFPRKPDIPQSFPSVNMQGQRIYNNQPHVLPQSVQSSTPLANSNNKPAPISHSIHLQPVRTNIIIPPQLPHPSAFRPPYISQYAVGHPLMASQVPFAPPPYSSLPLVLGYGDKRDVISNYSRLPQVMHPNQRAINMKLMHGDHNWSALRDGNHIMPEIDEYANLMSKREKDWLVNIQMLQLQSDNPYLDDFYYTSFMLKKRVRETKEKGPTLVIPERSKVIETKTYKPVQYEGSLGKLQAGSVTCPRKMIDVHTVHTDESEADPQKSANRETKRLKQLLLDIEKLYALLLKADDIDKRVVILPEEVRLPLYEIKREVISKMHASFIQQGGTFLVHMIAIRKGKNLVTRSISLFSREQLIILMTLVFSKLSSFLKRDSSDQMLAVIYNNFVNLLPFCDLNILNVFGEKLCSEREESSGKVHCQLALEHKLGVAFVCDIVNRAEDVYSEGLSNSSTDSQMKWMRVISAIIGVIEYAKLPIIMNFIPKLTFLTHIQRFSQNEKVIAIVRNWINELSLVAKT